MKYVLLLGLALILVAVISYSGYRLRLVSKENAKEARVHNWLMGYHPQKQRRTAVSAGSGGPVPTGTEANQSIVDLQAERPDVVGWLTVPNTNMDYPFVQGVDNNQYLHLDLEDRRSAAGTIFMDFRNSPEFTDFHTILYGHNMRNGSMFGTLKNFNDRAFFETNRVGSIVLANKTYKIEFMAFAILAPSDTGIYTPTIETDTDKKKFLDYVDSIARYYREIDVTTNDRIVTLSTCNYEFSDARMVLVGRLVAG